jgi:hypothetical protein
MIFSSGNISSLKHALANHYVDKQDVFENQLASSLAQSQF